MLQKFIYMVNGRNV